MIPDPFTVVEPGWERWQGVQSSPKFSQPDLTPRTLKEWLRSGEVLRAIAASQPPPPAPTPERGWSLANIPTFPRRTLGR
jgi:hypothetical protein